MLSLIVFPIYLVKIIMISPSSIVLLYIISIDYSFSFSLVPSKPFRRYCQYIISHSPPYIATMMTMSSSSSVTNSVSSNHWKTLDVNQFPNLTSNGCRFAKDEQYLKSVLDLWKQEEGKIRRDKR